ncbi:hypothetical protein N7453_005042 [Penicillium expansum]|nr:hypothetical protein N7453_005042 [Penicillium expansum]
MYRLPPSRPISRAAQLAERGLPTNTLSGPPQEASRGVTRSSTGLAREGPAANSTKIQKYDGVG